MRFVFFTVFIFITLINTLYAFTNSPFTSNELKLCKRHLLENITTEKHTMIKNDHGQIIYSMPGAVLASPSNQGQHFTQDYQFHWVRDAAITMAEVVFLYDHGNKNEKNVLRPYLTNYLQFEQKAQHAQSYSNEETLGQPKFNIDGTIWEGQWARPQNDSPALRAITLIKLAHVFKKEKDVAYFSLACDLAFTDLDYVAKHWHTPSYDLWEEIKDQDQFFIKMVARKALIAGALLSHDIKQNDKANTYLLTANAITQSLQAHWNNKKHYFSQCIHTRNIKGGDINVSFILGVIYGNLNTPNDPYAVNNDKIISSIDHIKQAFAARFTNHLLGRYPNDQYDGDHFMTGNPWILATAALAQYNYMLAFQLSKEAVIHLTPLNLSFYQATLANSDMKDKLMANKDITRRKNPRLFHTIIHQLIHDGDQLLLNLKKFATCDQDHTCLHFAEQIDYLSGKPASAKDLTWNYSILLSANEARNAADELTAGPSE